MTTDRFLNKLLKSVTGDMSLFRKELDAYKYVVDMTRVNPETAKKIEKRLNAKYPDLRNYDNWDDTVKVNTKSGRFFVLKTRGQLNEVSRILGENTEEKDLRFSEGMAAQERKKQFLLNKSTEARGRLSSTITNKTQQYLSLASPAFVSEFQDKLVGKMNSLTITFNVPESKELQQKLTQSVLHHVNKDLKDIKENTILGKAIQNRIDSLGAAFMTGKSLKKNTKSKKKVEGRKKNKNKKEYYVPLQDSSGSFISAPSLQATFNLLLHDTIEDKFMKPSGYPANRNYLRYQTGRFAKSANVLFVNKQRGATIDVVFDYMTDPYITFTSGSKNGLGRNPERIIEGAIRQIIIEHVSSNFNANVRMR